MLFFVALKKKKWSSSRKPTPREIQFSNMNILLCSSCPSPPSGGCSGKSRRVGWCVTLIASHSNLQHEMDRRSAQFIRPDLPFSTKLCAEVSLTLLWSWRYNQTEQNVSWHISLTKLHKNKSLVQKNVCLPTRASHSIQTLFMQRKCTPIRYHYPHPHYHGAPTTTVFSCIAKLYPNRSSASPSLGTSLACCDQLFVDTSNKDVYWSTVAAACFWCSNYNHVFVNCHTHAKPIISAVPSSGNSLACCDQLSVKSLTKMYADPLSNALSSSPHAPTIAAFPYIAKLYPNRSPGAPSLGNSFACCDQVFVAASRTKIYADPLW